MELRDDVRKRKWVEIKTDLDQDGNRLNVEVDSDMEDVLELGMPR